MKYTIKQIIIINVIIIIAINLSNELRREKITKIAQMPIINKLFITGKNIEIAFKNNAIKNKMLNPILELIK